MSQYLRLSASAIARNDKDKIALKCLCIDLFCRQLRLIKIVLRLAVEVTCGITLSILAAGYNYIKQITAFSSSLGLALLDKVCQDLSHLTWLLVSSKTNN